MLLKMIAAFIAFGLLPLLTLVGYVLHLIGYTIPQIFFWITIQIFLSILISIVFSIWTDGWPKLLATLSDERRYPVLLFICVLISLVCLLTAYMQMKDLKETDRKILAIKTYVDDQILKKAQIVSGIEIRPEQEAAFKQQTIADYEFSKGNNEKARSIYLAILNAYPATDELKSVLQNNIGATFANAGQREDAIVWYKKAQQFPNHRRNVDENLASTYFHLGDYKNALSEFHTLHEKNPKDYKINNQLGVVYSVAGQPDKAIEQFMIAARNNIQVRGMYMNIALNYFHKGPAFDMQGISFLEKEIALYPDNATAFFQLGAAYCWQQNFIKGIPLIEKAVMMDNSLVKSFPSFGLPEVNLPESDKINSIKILPGNVVQIEHSKQK